MTITPSLGGMVLIGPAALLLARFCSHLARARVGGEAYQLGSAEAPKLAGPAVLASWAWLSCWIMAFGMTSVLKDNGSPAVVLTISTGMTFWAMAIVELGVGSRALPRWIRSAKQALPLAACAICIAFALGAESKSSAGLVVCAAGISLTAPRAVLLTVPAPVMDAPTGLPIVPAIVDSRSLDALLPGTVVECIVPDGDPGRCTAQEARLMEGFPMGLETPMTVVATQYGRAGLLRVGIARAGHDGTKWIR